MEQWFQVQTEKFSDRSPGYLFSAHGPDSDGDYEIDAEYEDALGRSYVFVGEIAAGDVVPVWGPGEIDLSRHIPIEEVDFQASIDEKLAEQLKDLRPGKIWLYGSNPTHVIVDEPARLPLDSKERKEVPLFTFLNEYFPDAFIAVTRLSHKANEKHNPGEPMHWAREKSQDHKDCILRHLMDEERIDPETGEPEAVAAFWRAGANAQLVIEKLRREGKYHR